MKHDDRLLMFRIKSINNDIKRMFERTAIEKNDANLTGMQYGLLGYIGEKGKEKNVYQRDIEAEFNIRRSTASEMLRTLEDQGYIQREYDVMDTRLKKIILTEKAREQQKMARENFLKTQEKLLRGISEEELEQFYKTLQKISNNTRD